MKSILRIFFIVLSVAIVLILLWASVDKLINLHHMETGKVQFSANSIETHYRDHLMLGYIHIIPGILFLILGAHQLTPLIRNRNFRMHRLIGKIFLLLSAIIFVTAIVLGLFYPFGNYLESGVTLIFGVYLLYCTYKAYDMARRKQFHQHKNWVTRIYFIAIAVSTIRGLIALFMANGAESIQSIFGLAFFIAFFLHAFMVEVWIRYLAK